MAHIFEYAILTAVPDPRRGERVNVGLAVFGPDRIDVRIKDAAIKLKALTGESWEGHLDAMRLRIERFHEQGLSAHELCSAISLQETVFKPSKPGSFRTDPSHSYDDAVDAILRALVFLPQRERWETRSRLNTEISTQLRRVSLLAKRYETIDDGKVVRNFPVAENEGLIVDFALKNGRFCFAATLDLRRQTPHLATAALKAITLDKSRTIYGDTAKRLGVYAVDSTSREWFDKHIRLLADYADEIFDWTSQEGQDGLKRTFYDVLPRPFLRE